MKNNTSIESLEEEAMTLLLQDILNTQDRVEVYKAIDRYNAFVVARGRRITSEVERVLMEQEPFEGGN